MKTKLLFLTSVFLYCSYTGNAQQKKYTWYEDVCSYTGLYDPKKTSLEELKATSSFLMVNGYVDYDVAVNVEKAKKLDPKLLLKTYDSAKAAIRNLQLPSTTFWDGERKGVLTFLDQCYRLKKLTLEGYTHPEVLATYPLADSICLYYATALTKGGTALLDAWLTLTREQMARNGSPQQVWSRYEASLQRPDKMDIARSEVMIYGWWNNANHQLPHMDRYMARSKEFRKVFLQVKQHDCDEP